MEERKSCPSGSKILPRTKSTKTDCVHRIVLSLVAFARRPLRTSEVIEAVAMIRTAKNQNCKKSYVDLRRILDSCLSLVRMIRTDSNSENWILRLSHSAVRNFLWKNSDMNSELSGGTEPLVSSKIIRDCCFRYLFQPRYSMLLQKSSATKFWTYNNEEVSSHQLLSYAAKYWHLHFDDPSPDANDCAEVELFLRSTNFQTCIQIQSLFVIGYFLHSFDSITDAEISTRRTLPNWMRGSELSRQYLNFTSEWGELLRRGLSTEFNGEVDRCFWKALGALNFLSHNNSRYQSFNFSQSASLEDKGSICRVQQMSSDGKNLTLCWMSAEK
jgi:hypothetical protein